MVLLIVCQNAVHLFEIADITGSCGFLSIDP